MVLSVKNNKLKTLLLLVLFLTTLYFFSSFRNNDYDTFKNNYFNDYYNIISNINITNAQSVIDTLKTENNKETIKDMNLLLNEIKNKVPSDRKDEYNWLGKWYEGLLLIQNSNNWDLLSVDEKRKILNEISFMDSRKSEIEKIRNKK